MRHPVEPSVFRRGALLIGRSVATHPGVFTVSVIGAAIFGGMTVLMTVVLGRVTDNLILPAFEEGRPSTATLVGSVVAVLVVACLRAAGVVTRRYFAAMTTYRMQRTWRQRVADRYVDTPLAFHHERPAGRLLAHADTDVEVATEVVNPLPFTTGTLVLVVTAVLSLALVDWWLTLVAVGLFPLLAVVNRVYTAKVEAPAALVQARAGHVSAVAHESFDGALVVKTLGHEAAETDRMDRAADSLRQARLRVGTLRATFEPLIDTLPNLGMVLLLVVGAWRIDAGAVTTGEVVQALALFGVLAFPMRVVGYLLEELPRSVVAADRLTGVLEDAAAAVSGAPAGGGRSIPDGPIGVEVDAVRFGYGDGPDVVHDVSLTVSPGEAVALVGATGCGKSTLCHLVAGLAPPRSGEVRIGGVDIAHAPPGEVQAAVSLVFQETFLFADSLRENLDLGGGAGDEEIGAVARRARADGFIGELPRGLDTVVGERGVTLSGGQRQRVALARALLRHPRVLVLDDATSAIDPVIEGEILRGLRDDSGTTLVLVAHRLSTIRLADRVVFLDAGRVAAEGAHTDLLALPAYRALVQAYERHRPS